MGHNFALCPFFAPTIGLLRFLHFSQASQPSTENRFCFLRIYLLYLYADMANKNRYEVQTTIFGYGDDACWM